MSVKAGLTRAKRVRETPEYAGCVRRMVRAHGRRVGGADPEDLGELVGLYEVVGEAVADAVAGLREGGCSWAQIARGLGITRQAAQQRFGLKSPVRVMPGQVGLWSDSEDD